MLGRKESRRRDIKRSRGGRGRDMTTLKGRTEKMIHNKYMEWLKQEANIEGNKRLKGKHNIRDGRKYTKNSKQIMRTTTFTE